MPHSDDFFDDGDDTEFLAAATQIEASQHGGGFAPSPRSAKRRRRMRRGSSCLDGADLDPLEWSEMDDETHSPAEISMSFQSTAAPTKATTTETRDDEPESDLEYYVENANDDANARNSKYKIHVPKDGGHFPDAFFTQTQGGLDTDPGQFRGAVWKRPPLPAFPPPLACNPVAGGSAGLQLRKPSANAPVLGNLSILNFVRKGPTVDVNSEDERFAARLQAEEDALFHHYQATATRPNQPTQSAASFDVTQELADLPSDAFESSASERSPPKKAIYLSSQSGPSNVQAQGLRGPHIGLKQMTIFGQAATQDLSASQGINKKHAWPLKTHDESPTHHKLDDDAMKTWTYPTNLGTVRDYQYNIVKRSLFHNTLVALPTGLGKTFIAATVMLNYYRWTKDSQIVFMAPTKPLIAQQMDACYHIVGIPRRDTVLMTGETSPTARTDEWLEKRVFFMTPQTVINDLKHGIADPKKLVLLVVDEAHKATGGYAYTEVISFVRRFNSSFRVLALTATPGGKVESVQAVIDNLDIARVELRTEVSLDIRQYTHEKQTDTEIFDYNDEQNLIMEHLSKALKPQLDKLNTQNAYWSRDPMSLSAYGMNQSRAKWTQSDAGRKAPQAVKGMVNSIMSILGSFGHGIGLLKFHGIIPFYTTILQLQKDVAGGETKSKAAKSIVECEDFVKMSNLIRGWTNNPDFIGHPKLDYLRDIVLNHFLDAGDGRKGRDAPPSTTRVMVFASYRDSVDDICRVLKRSEPLIRPHVFVGQSGKVGSEGMNQKKQNAVVQDFKSGKYNTLIATSIGEEGLDIGDVDLIVCYDASASPIRMLQRIGRTGRKRMGRISLLLMRGKEENDYAKAQDNYAFIQRTIADPNKYNYHDDRSPRILPKHVRPAEDKRAIEIPLENSQPVDLNEKKRRGKGKAKRPPKKFHMPDGVRMGFVKASKIGSDNGGDIGDEPVSKREVLAKRNPPALPEPEVASVPFLQDVLLNSVRQKELERKYAHTAGDGDDIIIRAPDTNRFPDALRKLSSTRYIPHGWTALAVAKAIQAVHGIDDAKVQQMEDLFDDSFLREASAASHRLAGPDANEDDTDVDDLPDLPLSRAPPKKTPASKKTADPRRKQPVTRTASLPISKAKPAPVTRPRKKQALCRAMSTNSAAIEGGSSSPEPTPAEMRIGTQGIDLGSRDTSGEEEDEDPDSELEAFIARSDEIIEEGVVSSSLPGTPRAGEGRGLRRRRRDVDVVSSAIVVIEDDDGVNQMELDGEVGETPKRVPVGGRKRRVVEDSDESD